MNWKDGLTQNQVCETLMNNGKALTFLDELMNKSANDDHLVAISRKVYMANVPDLDSSFATDIGTALILESHLRSSREVVVYRKTEVGSLMRFTDAAIAGTTEAIASIAYIAQIPSMMDLNNAQVVELEMLLNKAGKTLGIDLPVVRPATEDEKIAALEELDLPLASIHAKPRASHAKFTDIMKAKGTPAKMTPKEFVAFVKSHL